MKKIKSPIKRKILAVLAGGVAMGLTHSPKTQRKIFKTLHWSLKEIDKQYLIRTVKEFHKERLIEFNEMKNGITTIVLSEKGKKIVLGFNIDKIEINKPLKWDKKWRMVMFDIPEEHRYARDVLREKLKEIGFKEIQKSVLVHPYPCLDEINFIVEYYSLRRYVRYGEFINLSNEEELRLKFNLV